MWTYKGIDIFPADRNASGIRWCSRDTSGIPAAPPILRADSKQGMRDLINHYLSR
jgi:hypothetical protein